MAVFTVSACSISITDGKQSLPTPDPNGSIFVPVEKEPYIDIKALQSSIIYPSEALRLRVEGKVNIAVLVEKSGIPKNYIVESADSPLLIAEAVRVVMNATYSPAIQNGQPIACWVSLPIIFKL
jgi:protein TonB